MSNGQWTALLNVLLGAGIGVIVGIGATPCPTSSPPNPSLAEQVATDLRRIWGPMGRVYHSDNRVVVIARNGYVTEFELSEAGTPTTLTTGLIRR